MRTVRWITALLLLCLYLGLTPGGLPAAAQLGAPASPASPASTVSPRAAKIKEDVRAILSSPEYRRDPGGDTVLTSAVKWIQRQLKKLGDWFRRLFSFGAGAGGAAGQALFWVIFVGLLVGLAYIIAMLVNKTGPIRRTKPGAKPGVQTLDPEEDAATDPEDLLAAARRHAEAGDYRRAYRAACVAILLRLDRQGLIRFDRARTNGEYLRALRERPALFALLRPLARDFDHRWYGGVGVDRADYERFLAAYQQVGSAAPPAGPTVPPRPA
jgi:hypothetical protein